LKFSAKRRTEIARKAWRTRKKRRPSIDAHEHSRKALTFSQVKLDKMGYKWKVPLLSRKGYEYKGIVDLVAIKRNNRRPDQLEIMLVQVKGGRGRVTTDEIERLKKAKHELRIRLAGAEMPGTRVRIFSIPS